MSLQITVTPGKTFTEDEAITYEKLNQLGVPNIDSTGSVAAAQIDANAVTEAKIASSSVTSDKIAANAVTLDKMEHGTEGDIIYYGAGGAPFRLGKGNDDEVLTLSSGLPSWQAPGDAGDIEVGSLTLDKLSTSGASTGYTIEYNGTSLQWAERHNTAMYQVQFDSSVQNANEVYFGLTGTDAGSGAVAGIQNLTQHEVTTGVTAPTITSFETNGEHAWIWDPLASKLWGASLAHNENVDTPTSKAHHIYDFEFGDAALVEAKGSALSVVETASLLLRLTYSIPFHGMALYQKNDGNTNYKLLWSEATRSYYHAGGTNLIVPKIIADGSSAPYKFRLVYWETATTPSTRPYFNLALTGYSIGQEIQYS
tara:strand:- start:1616 stop:2719 length:1104 start_codon:yes stop_codon:yes gene_type:complete